MTALTRPCRVTLSTDSMYVKDGITKWVHNWRRRGWTTAAGGEVMNRDLWEALLEQYPSSIHAARARARLGALDAGP